MRRLAYLLEKEFKHIFRDKFMPKLIIMVPIIQLLILPFAADFEMKNINLGVIDRDGSALSKRLAEKSGASKYFNAEMLGPDYVAAMGLIEQNLADIVMEIPQDFEKDITNEGAANVLLSVNAINGMKGGLGAAYLNSIISDFSREITETSEPYMPPSRLQTLTEDRYNPHLSTKAFIVPGVMVFLLSLIGGILSSLNIVSEKEAGTMEQMNVAPISKITFIASKIIPVWIIGMALLTIAILIAYFVYGLFPEGSLAIIYGFAAIYLTAFTAFGLILSNYSSTAQQAMLSFIFFVMLFLLLGGIFTPISSMPVWAQNLTLLNPVRYFVETMRGVYLRGCGFADLLPQFYTICAFAIALNIYAVSSFRRNTD